MNIDVLKTELSVIVPNELLQNVDYWYKIRDSFEMGYPMMTHAFLSYLYGKYGYDINLLKSQEIVSFLLEISRGIYEKTYWDIGHINSRPVGFSETINKIIAPCSGVPGTMIIPSQREVEEFSTNRGYYKLNPRTGKYEPVLELMNPWVSKPKIKDRKTLCDETPIAEFSDN